MSGFSSGECMHVCVVNARAYVLACVRARGSKRVTDSQLVRFVYN